MMKERDMKSIVITILLFAAVMYAIQFGVFEIMSSSYLYYISAGLLIIVLLIALKVLGNPLKNKDGRHDKK